MSLKKQMGPSLAHARPNYNLSSMQITPQSERDRVWCRRKGTKKMSSLSATLNILRPSLAPSPPSVRFFGVRNSASSYSTSRRLALFQLGSGNYLLQSIKNPCLFFHYILCLWNLYCYCIYNCGLFWFYNFILWQ